MGLGQDLGLLSVTGLCGDQPAIVFPVAISSRFVPI